MLTVSVLASTWAWSSSDGAGILLLIVDALVLGALVLAPPDGVDLVLDEGLWVLAIALALPVVWDSGTDSLVLLVEGLLASVLGALVLLVGPGLAVGVVLVAVSILALAVVWAAILVVDGDLALVALVQDALVLLTVGLPLVVDLLLAKDLVVADAWSAWVSVGLDLADLVLLDASVLGALIIQVGPLVVDGVEAILVLALAVAVDDVWNDRADIVDQVALVAGALVVGVVPLGVDSVVAELVGTDTWGWGRLGWSRVSWSRVSWSRVGWSRIGWSRVGWSRFSWTRGWSRISWSRFGWGSWGRTLLALLVAAAVVADLLDTTFAALKIIELDVHIPNAALVSLLVEPTLGDLALGRAPEVTSFPLTVVPGVQTFAWAVGEVLTEELVAPAGTPPAVLVVVKVLTWSQVLVSIWSWQLASTVLGLDASGLVPEKVTLWAGHDIVFASVDALKLGVALGLSLPPRVADLVALQKTLLWLGARGLDGLDLWLTSSGLWWVALELNAMDGLVDTVASFASI